MRELTTISILENRQCIRVLRICMMAILLTSLLSKDANWLFGLIWSFMQWKGLLLLFIFGHYIVFAKL